MDAPLNRPAPQSAINPGPILKELLEIALTHLKDTLQGCKIHLDLLEAFRFRDYHCRPHSGFRDIKLAVGGSE
jgi:hypothetical protein